MKLRRGASVRWPQCPTGRKYTRWSLGKVVKLRRATADVQFPGGWVVRVRRAELEHVATSAPADRVIPYAKFRTGLSFAQVRAMLWSASDDPATWRQKSRGVVLGLWHQLKREMYERMLDESEAPAFEGPANDNNDRTDEAA